MLRSSLEITKLQGQASACRSALWLFFLLAFGFDEFEFGLLRYAGLEAPSAARFVHIGSAHDDQVIRPAKPLRVLGGIAAAHPDGERLQIGLDRKSTRLNSSHLG